MRTKVIALLAVATAASLSACDKKKKSDGGGGGEQDKETSRAFTPAPTRAPQVVVTPTPTATEPPGASTGGTVPEGTTGAGTVLPRAELGLDPETVPTVAPSAVDADVQALSRMLFLVDMVPGPVSGVTLSNLETRTEGCAKQAMEAVKFEPDAAGFKLVSAFDFKACVEGPGAPTPATTETRKWTTKFEFAFRARCDNHDFKAYAGKGFADADVRRYLCFDSTSGEIYGHVRYEAVELDAADKPVRKYVRRKALTGKAKDTCAFVLVGGVRKYGDCVALDRVDSLAGAARYLEVAWPENESTATFDAQGQKYPGSKATVRANDWTGAVTFPADANAKGSWQLSNGRDPVKKGTDFPWPAEFGQASTIYKPSAPDQGQTQQQQGGATQQPTAAPSPTATAGGAQQQQQQGQTQGQ